MSIPAEWFQGPANRAAAVSVTTAKDAQIVEVRTNKSTYDWQVLSQPFKVLPNRQHHLEFGLNVKHGGMSVAIVKEGGLVVAAKNWCAQRLGAITGIGFTTDTAAPIRIVFANCSPTPAVSEFSVDNIHVW
jgi:hypothetical protein